MFINGMLESGQFEAFTQAGRPAPGLMPYRFIWVSDLSQFQVSDGVSWLPFTPGSGDREHAWELNGNYGALFTLLDNVDAIFLAPTDIVITSVWIYNGTAGAGTNEYDLKQSTSGGGVFTSVLTTTGKITSPASNLWTDSGTVIAPIAGVIKPVIGTPNISAGTGLSFHMPLYMNSPGADARMRMFYRTA